MEGPGKARGHRGRGARRVRPEQLAAARDGPALLRDLVLELQPHHIDKRRIYLFGYSAGAVFALYMAPREAEYFAAAAAYAGAYQGEADLGFLETSVRRPSREINERAWSFLQQHRLATDPVFVPVQFR